MNVAQISEPNGDWEIVERPIPMTASGQVRIKIQACGICHSDALVKDGHWPGLQYPRVPGHEVVGVVDELGSDVSQWKLGQRVGIGWHGGHCGHCNSCRSGNFFACQVALQTTGVSFDGGYGEYMVAPAIALAAVPDELSSVHAAPSMCAGITTYNKLRNSAARRANDRTVIHERTVRATELNANSRPIRALGRSRSPIAPVRSASGLSTSFHSGAAAVCRKGRR